MDRKTARRYVAAAEAAGLCREHGVEALTDELIGAVVAAVRPARPNGHGQAWDLLLAQEEQITKWVDGGEGQPALSIAKVVGHPAGMRGGFSHPAPVRGRAVRLPGHVHHDAHR